MPYGSIAKAKKAGATTTFRKAPISLPALNKLYGIYDGIKAKGKSNNSMATAMSAWKSLIVLRKGSWVLKPKKESKEQRKEQTDAKVAFSFPVAARGVGDGSYESFKDSLRAALKDLFGSGKRYVYIVATYRSKVIISVNEEGTEKSAYYEVPYSIKNNQFDFGTPVLVVKTTKFLKAEQKAWQEYRKCVRAFVSGKGTIADAVGSGFKVSREAL